MLAESDADGGYWLGSRERRERMGEAVDGSEPADFDSVAVCIVHLDAAGRITHVNAPWRQFAQENAADEETAQGVGQDYLAVCERSQDPTALALAAGLRSILTGRRESIEAVYSCHSGTQLRWFRVQARRSTNRHGRAVVLTHINITQQHLAEARSRIQGCVANAFATRQPLLASCRELAQTVCEALEWDFFGIWVLDPASWTFYCADLWSKPTLDLRRFEASVLVERLAPGVGLAGRVWLSRQALWVTDFETTDLSPETLVPRAAVEAGFRSGFAFAVKYDDDVLVVIDVFGRIRQQPDPELLHLLEISGVQLATAELRDRAERRAEAAQSEADDARERLEAVLQCVPALVVAIERDGLLRFVNKPAPNTLEADGADTSWRDLFPPGTHPRLEADLQLTLEEGTPTQHDTMFVKEDGTRVWSTNYVVPVRTGEQVSGALIVSYDTTQLKRAYEDLIDAQRLAAIGTLAAGVAHEINTPIQFVGDSVDFLRESAADVFALLDRYSSLRADIESGVDSAELKGAVAAVREAEEQADLEYLRENVPGAFARCHEGLERVTSIVRSMKEFSHPSHTEMAPTDLNRAILATLTVARSEYKYVADLETELGELPPVMCHVNAINQAVLNIVVNAAHAISDKSHASATKGVITVRTRVDGPTVVIAISDSGGGIPEDIRHRIFEPFFTTKEVGRGTGQGLAIARTAIQEKHGGELSFETQVGKGTTFYIRLPIAGREAHKG